jgi:hypothetical protein
MVCSGCEKGCFWTTKEANIRSVYGKKPVRNGIFLVTLFVFSKKYPLRCYGLTGKELILSCTMQYNLI